MASSMASPSSKICVEIFLKVHLFDKVSFTLFCLVFFCMVVHYIAYIIEHIKDCQEHHEREMEKAFGAQK